jgi:hypothetical protein
VLLTGDRNTADRFRLTAGSTGWPEAEPADICVALLASLPAGSLCGTLRKELGAEHGTPVRGSQGNSPTERAANESRDATGQPLQQLAAGGTCGQGTSKVIKSLTIHVDPPV